MTRRSPQQATGRNRPHATRVTLRLEALEDRTLLSAAAATSILVAPGAYDPSQVLVQFRPEALTAGAPTLNIPGAVLGQSLSLVPGLYDVQLNGLSVPAALAILQADPRVLSAEPDYLVAAAGTPNDPEFGGEWGLLNTGQSGGTAGVDVHATQAWNVATSSPGVVVALNDTGVDYDNRDLYQNIWINQAEIPNQWYTKSSITSTTYDKLVLKSQIKTATPGVITFADLNNPVNKGLVWDNNGDGVIDAGDLLRPLAQGGWDSGSTKDGDAAHPDDFFGWNFIANNNNPFDDNDHGTNVASILGAQGNNGVGVAGVDWGLQIQDLKVFNASGFSSISAIISAFAYSIQHGAKISNNSWSVSDPSSDLLTALTNARAAGQIVVAAAGNEGAATPDYPALYAPQLDNIVSVAAITNTGQLWTSSNYGASTVTLAAPGVNILGAAPGGGYDDYTGTSQAVPFVTGTLALVWGQHPTWTYKQVIAQVTSTTTPLASLKGKTVTGGIVNAAAAVGAAAPGGVSNPAPPPTQAAAPQVLSASFSGPDSHSLNRIIVTFDQVMNAATFTTAQVRLTNPSGQVVTLTATKLAPGSGGNQWEIDFNTQTAGGTYTLTLSGVKSTAGVSIASYTATYGLIPAAYVFQSTGALPIPDLGTATSTITVNQGVYVGSALGSVQVTLNISHTYDSDLFIVLQAPDGSQALLVNREGGAGHNFVNTVLTDTASTSIRTAFAPFTGTFQAESSLSIFAGKNAQGAWKLIVRDEAAGDVGVINSWTLTIKPGPGVASEVTEEKDNAPLPLTTGAPQSQPAATVPATGADPGRAAAVDTVFQSLGGARRTQSFGWMRGGRSWRACLARIRTTGPRACPERRDQSRNTSWGAATVRELSRFLHLLSSLTVAAPTLQRNRPGPHGSADPPAALNPAEVD